MTGSSYLCLNPITMKDRQFPHVVLYLLALFVLLSFLAVYLALRPAFLADFDLTSSNAANIGVTIGGITSPVIALFSSLLLFFTLYEQIKANDTAKKADAELRERNSADILFLLYNQLETEIRELSIPVKQGAEHVYGYDALYRLCLRLTNSPEHFADRVESNKIRYIIQSYTVIDEHLKTSRLSAALEQAVSAKLTTFYLTKLRDPLRELSFGIRHNSDGVSKEVLDFFTAREQKLNPGFDLQSIENRDNLFKDR